MKREFISMHRKIAAILIAAMFGFLSFSSLMAAAWGLPYIEDLSALNLSNLAKTTADWSIEQRVLPVHMALAEDNLPILLEESASRDLTSADPWVKQAKLTADDGATDDEFGYSVSISGDTVVVGASWDDNYSGSSYIFDRDYGGTDNWGQVAKITAGDGAADDEFGSSVAISGDTVVGLAPGNGDSGAAYIFYRHQGGADNWGQVKKITAGDSTTGGGFTNSISISGDTVAVGGPHETNNGSAYIFYRNHGGTDNWGQVTKITGAADGGMVFINGDTLVVGATYDDGYPYGSANIFYRNQGGTDHWGKVTKITPSDDSYRDFFGCCVCLSGDTLVVGAYADDDNGADSGSAYIFERNEGGADSWGEVKKITPADGASGDNFGTSVSISGGTVVVGARWDDNTETNSGSACIFNRNEGGADNWGQVTKVTPDDAAAYDNFGSSVSNSGDTVVGGSPYDDDNGNASGSAYIYVPVDLCECDFEPIEGDEDVDGADLAAYLADNAGMSLAVFAGDFGRTNCP